MAGNETCLHAGRAVPARHNLQGTHTLYPIICTDGEQSSQDDLSIQIGQQSAECKAPGYGSSPVVPVSWLKLVALCHAGIVLSLVVTLQSVTELVCWSPGAVALTSLAVFLRQESGWSVGWLAVISIPFFFGLALCGLVSILILIRFQALVWRARGLWAKHSISGSSSRALMLGKQESWAPQNTSSTLYLA